MFKPFWMDQPFKLGKSRWAAYAAKPKGAAKPRSNSGGTSVTLLDAFWWQTQDVYPTVEAYRGDFRNNRGFVKRAKNPLAGPVTVDQALPPGMSIGVFADDAAKDVRSLATDLSTVADRLRPGSLVVLADFFFWRKLSSSPSKNQIHWVFKTLVPQHLKLVGVGSTNNDSII